MTTSELDQQLHASVMKREAVKERAFREEKARLDEEVRLSMGTTEMTKEELKKIIDSDRRMYYRTEELNDKLYMHYKGWRKIQNLEGWTGLKALYAECNAFDKIEGLQNCRLLRSLVLSENCIRRIEGLENCTELWSLNLSSNFIERIEGLSTLTKLNTLIVAKNKIGLHGLEDVEELAGTNLCSLDLQENRLDDPDVLPEVFMQMPELRVLYLKGNTCCKKVVNYRKSTTVYCKNLKYLDDRPVFPEDRRAAEAFNRGGLEEERAERRLIKEEEREKHDRNMRLFNEMIENSRREARERKAMREEDKFTDDTDPVDSVERRTKRAVEQWKAANAKDLKDDAREHAEKCLQAERAAAEKAQTTPAEAPEPAKPEAKKFEPPPRATQPAASKAEEGSKKPSESSAHAAQVDAEDEEELSDEERKKVDNRKLVYEDIWGDDDGRPAQTAEKDPIDAKAGRELEEAGREEDKKVDTRKLVYEDIWGDADDRPPTGGPKAVAEGSAVTEAKQPAAATGAAGAKAQRLEPQTTEVFLPWASGDGVSGMEAVAPAASVLEERKATLQGSTGKAPVSSADAELPAWYAKYAEQPAPPRPTSSLEDEEAAPKAAAPLTLSSELDGMD